MIHTPLSLTILLITLAYIGLWLLIAFLGVAELVQRQAARNSARRLGSIEEKQSAAETSVKPQKLFLLPLVFLIGSVLAWLALGRLQPVLLLAGLLIVGLILEELREAPRLVHLPAVLGLLEGLRANDTQDVFAALQEVAETLPPGKVRSAVMAAVSERSGGAGAEQSLAVLKGINPYLDELAVDLRNAGWQTGPTLTTALASLARRASGEWRAVGQRRMLVERLRPLIPPVRALLIGAMSVAAYASVLQLDLNAIRPTLLAGAVVTVGFLGVLLHDVFTHPWLRRALGTAILVTLFLLSVTFFQDVTPEVVPALAATSVPAAVEISTFTYTPPPMLTQTPASTPPLPAVPTSKPTTDPARDPSPTQSTITPGMSSPTPPLLPATATPQPAATDQPAREPTDTPPAPPSRPTDTPPPPPEDLTSTPPVAPGGNP